MEYYLVQFLQNFEVELEEMTMKDGALKVILSSWGFVGERYVLWQISVCYGNNLLIPTSEIIIPVYRYLSGLRTFAEL